MDGASRVYTKPLAMTLHAERILDAATMTQVADPVNRAAFDKAVEATGLI